MRGTGELVIYLDFDGVLHHENCLWHQKIGAYLSAPDGYVLFQHAELLEQLLAPYPQVQIVLSTSWVPRYGCSKAAKNLRPALRSRVIGATYHSNMREHEFTALPRGLQVWLDVVKRNPMPISLNRKAERLKPPGREGSFEDLAVAMQTQLKRPLPESATERATLLADLRRHRLVRYASSFVTDPDAYLAIRSTILGVVSNESLSAALDAPGVDESTVAGVVPAEPEPEESAQ